MEWISFQNRVPDTNDLIWIGSIKYQSVKRGYVSKGAIYDENGNGISGSHWMTIFKPSPPKI